MAIYEKYHEESGDYSGSSFGVGWRTYSFFSATDSIDGNTISTATVEIDAKGEAGQGVMAKPIATSNLVPGQYTEWARGAVWNKSTVPVRLYMYADNLQAMGMSAYQSHHDDRICWRQ